MHQNGHPTKTYMQAAIMEAQKAKSRGQLGVAALIVRGHEILATESDASKTSTEPIPNHAAILAIKKAGEANPDKPLTGCVMYLTHEPCPICATAIILAKIEGLVIGASLEDFRKANLTEADRKYLGQSLGISAVSILEKSPHHIFVIQGYMAEENIRLILNER